MSEISPRPPAPLTTRHLELVPATAALAHLEFADRPGLFAALDVAPPENWPPPLNDESTIAWTRDRLDEDPAAAGWWGWYFLRREGPDGPRALIGCGGFKGRPDAEGTVEIDYSLLEPFQHRGYATEAVSALVAWAARRDGVRTVAAETLPSLTRSIGVLHRVGFRQVPSRAGDTLRFERTAGG